MDKPAGEREFQENELPDDNRLNHGHTRITSIEMVFAHAIGA